jgi:hypothetical protein
MLLKKLLRVNPTAGLGCLIKRYFEQYPRGTRVMDEFFKENLRSCQLDWILVGFKVKEQLTRILSNSKGLYRYPLATDTESSEDENEHQLVEERKSQYNMLDSCNMITDGVRLDERTIEIWKRIYDITLSHYASLLRTPQAIPKDIHNTRLVCKAARDGAQEAFQNTFFSSRRITFDAGSLGRHEALTADKMSHLLVANIKSLAFIADYTEAENRQRQLNKSILHSEEQRKIDNIIFFDEKARNETTERIIKLVKAFYNVKSFALIDTEAAVDSFGYGFRSKRTRLFCGSETADDKSVFLSRRGMRSTALDNNFAISTAMRCLWHVLRSVESVNVDHFTLFAEVDFLDFDNTDYRIDFRFLHQLKSFTWIGDRCRAKDFKYKTCTSCYSTPEKKCPHTPPAPYVVQLAKFRNQFFAQTSNLKKLEVGYMHIVQSGFWDSFSGDFNAPDPLGNLGEIILWKSEIHYEKLISLLNRAAGLRRLDLNDVYLYHAIRGKPWVDFFDYFFEDGPQNCLQINIQGMLWTSWLSGPWKREDMFKYFQDWKYEDYNITIRNSHGEIVTEDCLEMKEYEAPRKSIGRPKKVLRANKYIAKY